jgi:hypothetical protein
MLRHFEHEAVAVVVGFERRQNRRQVAVELTSTTAPMTWLILPVQCWRLTGAFAMGLPCLNS